MEKNTNSELKQNYSIYFNSKLSDSSMSERLEEEIDNSSF